MFDFRAHFCHSAPRKRTLSTSDSEPTPRRAKSDFLSVFLSVAISYQLLVTLEGNMCGIIALYARRREVDPETVRRATASLRHRGPDGQRHWLSPDRRIGLGHARLSIIDLTTAINRSPARISGRRLSATASSTGTKQSRRNWKGPVIACGPGATAKSRFISMRILDPNACTGCAASLLS